MEKAYNITDIRFDDDYLIIMVDNQLIKLKLADISDKLAKATDQERKDYKISPSGYGIHWRLLDEDLSVNGLLKTNKAQHSSQTGGQPRL
jgi:hypothetical protein